MNDLALQVGEVDGVAVAHGDAADAARREVEERRRAEAARADDERVCGEQALLRLLAKLVQQQVPAIAKTLAIVHEAEAGPAPSLRGGGGGGGGGGRRDGRRGRKDRQALQVVQRRVELQV